MARLHTLENDSNAIGVGRGCHRERKKRSNMEISMKDEGLGEQKPDQVRSPSCFRAAPRAFLRPSVFSGKWRERRLCSRGSEERVRRRGV